MWPLHAGAEPRRTSQRTGQRSGELQRERGARPGGNRPNYSTDYANIFVRPPGQSESLILICHNYQLEGDIFTAVTYSKLKVTVR